MSTTFGELKRQVLLRMGDKRDGKSILAVEQAINDALKVLVTVNDFDDLMVLDTANAATVANQANYHTSNDWGLTRLKDVYSIRYMANEESRKLVHVTAREVDAKLPYPAILGTGKPSFYTRRGANVELIPTPDEASNLYILHSQWPATLANDTDECPIDNIDPAVISLATDIAYAILDGSSGDWFQRAKQLMGLTMSEDASRPDEWKIAKPFSSVPNTLDGEYWNNPFIRSQP